MPESGAAEVNAVVAPTDVVAHEHHDVGFVLGGCWRSRHRYSRPGGQANLVTIETIAAQLDEDRRLAYEQGQASAAVAASMSKAKLFGLITDRREIEGSLRKPLREPLSQSELRRPMSLEEWQAKFAPKSRDLASGADPDGRRQ